MAIYQDYIKDIDMKAGQLNQIIKVYNVQQVKDEYGSTVNNEVLYRQIKSNVKYNTGDYKVNDFEKNWSDTITITIRQHYNINYTDIIVFNKYKYMIKSIQSLDRDIIIIAERINE